MSHLLPAQLADQLEARRQHLAVAPRSIREGKLKRVSGIVLEVEGLPMSIGTGATILSELGGKTYDAECIGFNGAITYLMPIDTMEGISPGALVYPANTPFNSGSGYTSSSVGEPLPIGENLLGRVVDGLGRPIDGKGYGEKQFRHSYREP